MPSAFIVFENWYLGKAYIGPWIEGLECKLDLRCS